MQGMLGLKMIKGQALRGLLFTLKINADICPE